MKKIIIVTLIIAAVVIAGLVVYAYIPRADDKNVGDRSKLNRTFSADEQVLIEQTIFSAAELEEHNGKDGAKAYIAVDGVVYDVSSFGKWERGRHHGVKAGADVTEKFVSSKHALDRLESIPVMGGFEQE